MPLVFHKLRSNAEATGASVNVLLQEGLFSLEKLREMGKLPPKKNLYGKAFHLQRREKWRAERRETLKDNPDLLEKALAGDREEKWWSTPRFDEPGFEGNREENVFFSYAEHPPQKDDWVALEVSGSTRLHDAACRESISWETSQKEDDRYDKHCIAANRWCDTSVSIEQFQQLQARGASPRWFSLYNETLIRDHVPAERIVAYAKVEKDLPLEGDFWTEGQQKQVQDYISRALDFATQFPDPADNVLFSQHNDSLHIRVAFNKEKITGREPEVAAFFDRFSSMQELLKAAQSQGTDKSDWVQKTQRAHSADGITR